MDKLVDQTISAPHHGQPKRMEQVATHGDRSPQQQPELHYRLRSK
jgi:hypothetical protein